MSIKHIKEKLLTAEHPAVSVLQKGSNFKILAIGFNKGMILSEHKTKIPAKLTVLEGRVRYDQEGEQQLLDQYDEHDIPADVLHAVVALEDSLCLLVQAEV